MLTVRPVTAARTCARTVTGASGAISVNCVLACIVAAVDAVSFSDATLAK
ncbi:hypothetical protein [Streptomyces mutabilis]